MITRRAFIGAAASASSSVFFRSHRVLAQASQEVVMSAMATTLGTYLYMPVDVPAGVNRISVAITKAGGDAKTGAGIFDERGTAYQENGFRGIYGEERAEFFVAADSASQSFLPGRINPGTWTVIVPVFTVTVPTQVTARVRLDYGSQLQPLDLRGGEQGVVVDEPGWYRGDLHCHTPESSDAWKSGSAMTPRQWAEAARTIGLDFLAMTDHNVVTQNIGLADAAGGDVLLMPGEEMTNWFHGHATVSGFDAGDWLDWRQTPGGLPLPSGNGRIQDFMRFAGETGAYVAAAHPLAAHLSWQFFAEGDADALARPHGLEIWTGPFQPDDEAALKLWDEKLRAGWKVWANGGTDLHGVQNTNGFVAGTPTTVVYAEQLSKKAAVEALKLGRSFVTRRPDGVELYLTAGGPGGQRQIVGGTIYGEPGDTVAVEVLVRRAAGMRLIVVTNASPVSPTAISSDEERVTLQLAIGSGGYVRAEVRGAPEIDPARPTAGRLDMEAFTNPIFLAVGEPPPGTEPVSAPPGAPGPRRGAPQPKPAATLPATGGATLLVPAAVAAGAAVVLWRMTNSELVHRAGVGEDLSGREIALVGRLSGTHRLVRTVEPCPCHQREVVVELGFVGDPSPADGDWVEVTGAVEAGTGEGFAEPPVLRVRAWRHLDLSEVPDLREDR